MKLVSYKKGKYDHLAVLLDGLLYDMNNIHPDLPDSMKMFLEDFADVFPVAQHCLRGISNNAIAKPTGFPVNSVELLSPVPFPSSCRDGYAFRRHVESARRNRGLDMIAAFDEYPVFYFTNHHAVQGPGDVLCMPDHFEKLDFELEVAAVIGRRGRNIPADHADRYIAGLMIMNDFSARTLQQEEMLLSLAPAKGKDFSTSFGPSLVTTDELRSFEIPCKKAHTGRSWNLRMCATVNGVKKSEGNLSDMDWTFAELIERASYGADVFPGDIVGSGTIGTGCFLELNGTNKLTDPDYGEEWLREGDTIDLVVEGLGTLRNTIMREQSDMSLLQKKKTIFS